MQRFLCPNEYFPVPRFSIIVVHYQPAVPHPIFCRGIASLRAQTFKDFEILCYHDGPLTDPSVQFPIPVRCTPTHHNDWGHSLRDLGIRQAAGDYLVHFNADNVLYPYALQAIASEIARPARFEDTDGKILDSDDIVIFPIAMFGYQRINNSTVRVKGNSGFYTLLTGNPPMVNNIDCMQLVMKRALWLAEGGWSDKRSDSDGYLYERFARKYGYREVGRVLGEHH